MEQDQAKFEGWAIVELMGHQREAGWIRTEHFGQAALFRIEVPELPEREYTLTKVEWSAAAGDYLRPGSKVKRAGIPGRTRFVSPAAVYALNPCTEAAAIAEIEDRVKPPIVLLEVPPDRQLVVKWNALDGEQEPEA